MTSRPLAIFDLDGTLIDSRRDLADAGNAARAALGLPPLSLSDVQGMIGDGASKLIERLTPGYGSAERNHAFAAFRSDYATRLTATTRVYAGIAEALAELRARGWQLAVATNKPAVFAQPILDQLGIAVDALRGGDGPKKPDPSMLLDLMTTLGASVTQTWMIGDHHTDLAAAKNAKLRSIWCTWGFGQRNDEPATAIAHKPADMLSILSHG